MKIKITADSTADLTNELKEMYNISIMPISVIVGGEEKRDGIDITTEEMLAYCDEHKELPKTSAPNAELYAEFFEENLKGYDALIHLNLSSELSSIHKNAKDASTRFDGKVFAIDTRTLSTGMALLAIYASELAQSGELTAQEVHDKVVSRIPKVQASFILDKLKYLHMGGRCSAVALFGANLLKIKPSIKLQDGKMGVAKKYLGKFQECIRKYVTDTLAEFDNPDRKRVFVTHTPTNPEYVEMIKEILKDKFDEVIESHAGSTIASHCGRDTIGILYINDGGKC